MIMNVACPRRKLMSYFRSWGQLMTVKSARCQCLDHSASQCGVLFWGMPTLETSPVDNLFNSRCAAHGLWFRAVVWFLYKSQCLRYHYLVICPKLTFSKLRGHSGRGVKPYRFFISGHYFLLLSYHLLCQPCPLSSPPKRCLKRCLWYAFVDSVFCELY